MIITFEEKQFEYVNNPEGYSMECTQNLGQERTGGATYQV